MKMKFTFNKKARARALSAIRKLEQGSTITAILGAFGAKPEITAIASAVLFIVCRVGETVIAGIEDVKDDNHETRNKESP